MALHASSRGMVDLFPGYKLNRLEADASAGGGEAEPDLLTPQIGPIIELCTLLGLHPISVEDQEADDVIATLANVSTDTSIRVMTGDRDLFQLIRLPSDVQIIYLAKGISQHDLVDGKLHHNSIRNPCRSLPTLCSDTG